jgi:hypothetical protein
VGRREDLIAEIEEAKLRLSDLTRELDESPAAEQNPMFGDTLQHIRDCVIALERALEALNRPGS